MFPEELARFPLFEGLSPEQIDRLAPMFSRVSFQTGEMLFAEGDRAENVYVIETGEVVLRYRPHDGDWLTIASVGAGGVVGWSAALGRPRYTSSAVCRSDVSGIAVRGVQLRAAIRADAALGVLLLGRMAMTITRRETETQNKIGGLIHREVGQADRKES